MRVAKADRVVGRILEELEEDGWLEDSLVVFFSDHGQSLGERGYHGHHVYLYSVLMDVPLVVLAPGTPPSRCDALVELTDVAPTILHFLDLEIPEGLAGRSLLTACDAFGLPAAPGGADRFTVAEAFPGQARDRGRLYRRVAGREEVAERMALVQSERKAYAPKVAIVQGDWRLVVNRETGASELYDVARDPENVRDLSRRRPDVLRRMEALLVDWHARESERIWCSAAER